MKNQSRDIKAILAFLHEAERLKTVLRHSWLSSGRKESTAEHTWRMALMAVLCAPYIHHKVSLEKTLKMILIHDLTEVHGVDYPAFKKRPADKFNLEKKALEKILKPLPKKFKKEFLQLWIEYETDANNEAHLAKAMDKMEVILQHNECDIKKLIKLEYKFNLTHGYKNVQHDPFLLAMRDVMNKENIENYKKNNISKKLYE